MDWKLSKLFFQNAPKPIIKEYVKKMPQEKISLWDKERFTVNLTKKRYGMFSQVFVLFCKSIINEFIMKGIWKVL